MEVAEWKWPPILFLRPPLLFIIIVVMLLADDDNADGGSVQIILNYEVINDNGSYQKAGEILHKFIYVMSFLRVRNRTNSNANNIYYTLHTIAKKSYFSI